MSIEQTVKEKALELLIRNRMEGVAPWNGQRYSFSCPSRTRYPFQFFWDSCFHAIALAHLKVELAAEELCTLLKLAQPDGFIPHIIFWEKEKYPQYFGGGGEGYAIALGNGHWTVTIQPPVLAQAVAAVYHASADKAFLREVLPKAKAYYRWLQHSRDPDNDGLIAIVQPDESGLDSSPKYDAYNHMEEYTKAGWCAATGRLIQAYGPYRKDQRKLIALDLFHFEDVLVNSIWIQGLHALADLCATIEQGEEANSFTALALKAERAILTKCYDPEVGAFFDLATAREHPVRVLTITSLMPVLQKTIEPSVLERLVKRHITNPKEFWLPYPLPSVAASEPSFDPAMSNGLLWRGPTWLNTNWLIYKGLKFHGYHDLADRIRQSSLELVLKSGFWECFNPYTGEGYGADNFGWSTLVVDMLD